MGNNKQQVMDTNKYRFSMVGTNLINNINRVSSLTVVLVTDFTADSRNIRKSSSVYTFQSARKTHNILVNSFLGILFWGLRRAKVLLKVALNT